jgi:hypothetical protein
MRQEHKEEKVKEEQKEDSGDEKILANVREGGEGSEYKNDHGESGGNSTLQEGILSGDYDDEGSESGSSSDEDVSAPEGTSFF